MITGAPERRAGYFHEAVHYDSDDELLAVAVPFLLGGVEAGEPTIVALGERNAGLMRDALEGAPVIFQAGGDLYSRPAAAIRAYRTLFADHVARGARRIRVIGELPTASLGVTWDWWARYESAINDAYDEFPLWSMCAYDTRTTPRAVLADVARTHPYFALSGERHAPSADYLAPGRFLRHDLPMVPDPLQHTPPTVELVDPTSAQARAVVTRISHGVLPPAAVADLRIAITETVTNATNHGVAPALVRCWTGPDRVVVTVADRGTGPVDPFAGLRAAAHAPTGGMGLWLTHQLCDHVAMSVTDDGFTVRMICGNPYHRVEV